MTTELLIKLTMVATFVLGFVLPFGYFYTGKKNTYGKKNIFAKRVIHIGKPLSYEELGFSNDEEPSPREYREASRIIMEQISKFREMDRKDK